MFARVGTAQRTLLVTVALEHRGIQIQAVARDAFRQSFELPVPQAREKTLILALPEALEQVANRVVDGAPTTTESKNAVKVFTGSIALGERRENGRCSRTASQ